ncbi:MAG: isopentenyl transferase family protein, partial [Sphaerochaetaceae bacterium]|nr:isopentenyl transferase family protein [Sphaerochaetaceae bacterium]MDD4396649.1 isopentenyl transferase family protein [Sphaerochaetaceae bacterium]
MTTRTNSNGRIVFLFGPTAVGKTALLFNVFAEGFEVINADSVQVYRHLDIGSAKATAEERARIPHHLIDI